jgi:hypothetical protein
MQYAAARFVEFMVKITWFVTTWAVIILSINLLVKHAC